MLSVSGKVQATAEAMEGGWGWGWGEALTVKAGTPVYEHVCLCLCVRACVYGRGDMGGVQG